MNEAHTEQGSRRRGSRHGERLAAALLGLVPQVALSRLTGWLAGLRTPLTPMLVRWFVRRNAIDLGEAADPDPSAYASFNAFFTRRLRDDARVFATEADAVVSPVDGTVSEVGRIDGGRLLQAKGRRFTVQSLLALDERGSAQFADGSFVTLYLSPRDYHRVHMPVEGTLQWTRRIPGRLYSVAPWATRSVHDLYARNARLVCRFDSQAGPLAQVLVGALNVGSIETVWNPQERPYPRRIHHREFAAGELVLPRGAEMGRFNLGSTVVLLFGRGIEWRNDLAPGSQVRVGESIGHHADRDGAQARS